MKSWLDHNIVPLLRAPDLIPPLSIHSEIHSSPPHEGGVVVPDDGLDMVCVYLLAPVGSWTSHVIRLLKSEFYWDYMRDLTKVELGVESRIVFGGDGSPFIHDNNMVSCRLFQKPADIAIILEIGCTHSNKLAAQDDVKDLYAKFKDDDGLDFQQVQERYTPPFGGQ